MGINQSKFTLECLIGKKITNISLIAPVFDMIDYDRCYTIGGEVTFNLEYTMDSDESDNRSTSLVTGYFNEVYHDNAVTNNITKAIKDTMGVSVNITTFLNKTITNVEKIVTVNRWYPNKYYYLFTLDSGESYQMYFNRMKLHKCKRDKSLCKVTSNTI